MNELIRFHKASCHLGEGCTLDGYSLTVFSGEIVCLVGITGNGQTAIERVLTGQVTLSEGLLFVQGHQQCSNVPLDAFKYGIYSLGMSSMAPNMSIVDNLHAIKYVGNPFQFYFPVEKKKEVAEILGQCNIYKEPNMLVKELSFIEEQMLSLMKMKGSKAKLILVNCIHKAYNDQDAATLGKMMKQMASEGISFLISCEKPNVFFDIADKVQILQNGMDVYQWGDGFFNRNSFNRIVEKITKIRTGENSAQKIEAVILLDLFWNANESVIDYLKTFYRNNKELWAEHIGIKVPESNSYYDGETVIIPYDSSEKLLSNLSIGDNLVLCVPHRVGGGWIKVVNRRVQKVVVKDFFSTMGIPAQTTKISDLTDLQRKILSIHRWVLARPYTIVLENPFWGLSFEEIHELNAYLLTLVKSGAKLIICSMQLWEFENYDGKMITSYAGKKAKLV